MIVPLVLLMSVAGIIAAYMPTFESFIVARFLHALIYIGEDNKCLPLDVMRTVTDVRWVLNLFTF